MNAHAIRSSVGPCLCALLLAPAATSARDHPGDHALQLLGVSPLQTLPRRAGTAILVAFEHEHYILTALHVARSGGRLLVQVGPPGVKDPQFCDLAELVERAFRVHPAADVCAFRCTEAGFRRLTGAGAGKRPISLQPLEVEVGRQVVVLGNPDAVIFPGAPGQVPFVVENVPASGIIQAVRAAGEVFGARVEGDARATRLVFIGHDGGIRPGFGGGPVLFRPDGGRTYELAGMLEGRDPIAKDRAWAVTTADLIKAIGSGQVLHFPPDTWPEVLLLESTVAPRPPAGGVVDLPEMVGEGPDRALIEAIAARVTSSRDPAAPVDPGVLEAWRKRREELAQKAGRSPAEEYLDCLLSRSLRAFGAAPEDGAAEERVAGYLERLEARLAAAGSKLKADEAEAGGRPAELQERGEHLESLARVFLVEALGAWRRRDLPAAAGAFDRYLKLVPKPAASALEQAIICHAELADELVRRGRPGEADRHRAQSVRIMLSMEGSEGSLEGFVPFAEGGLVGWFLKRTKGDARYSVDPDPADGGDLNPFHTALRLRCDDASFAFWRRVQLKPGPETRLCWEWKADRVPMELPPNGVRLAPGQDGPAQDAANPIQVIVGFARLPFPVFLHYTWNGAHGLDSSWKYADEFTLGRFLPVFGELAPEYPHLVVESGGPKAGWVAESRKVCDDYRRFYGKEKIPRIFAIGIQATTYAAPPGSNVGDASIRNLRFITP